MKGEVVKVVISKRQPQAVTGSAGLKTQVPGAMTTVSNLAGATGGMKPGNLAETDNK